MVPPPTLRSSVLLCVGYPGISRGLKGPGCGNLASSPLPPPIIGPSLQSLTHSPRDPASGSLLSFLMTSQVALDCHPHPSLCSKHAAGSLLLLN